MARLEDGKTSEKGQRMRSHWGALTFRELELLCSSQIRAGDVELNEFSRTCLSMAVAIYIQVVAQKTKRPELCLKSAELLRIWPPRCRRPAFKAW